MTELEAAAELEYFMKKEGAEDLGFNTIIASGLNSSMPHAIPSEKPFEEGDFITFDFGCKYKGYRSDMTRTVVLGKASEKQKEIYNIVLKAQLAALDAIKAGMKGCEVDKVARDIITEAGYGEYFGHGLGHSVGLEIHEEPRLSVTSETVLQANMIETIEPGIYIPGFGGVRIEDMILVTEEGHINYAHSPKELIEIPVEK
jgi:Xaa-Pro aminopeptidase